MRPSSRSRRWPSLLVVAACFAPAMLACQLTTIDLGSNRAATTGDAGDSGRTTMSDCPTATEAEVQALYGHPCASTCADSDGPPRVVTSSVELVAVTAGRWRTCAGEVPWATDVIGLEFQAGCTLFLLHDAPDGGVVRGVEPDDQGTFNVVETTEGDSVTRAVEIYFPSWTWRASVTTSDCPHRMRLSRAAGGSIDLVGIPSASAPFK